MGSNAPIDISHFATAIGPAPDPSIRPMMTAEHAASFVPADDRIVAIADVPLDKLRGIWLPDQRNSRFEWTVYGVVVAIGPGLKLADGTRQAIDVDVGDRIVWSYRPSREEQTMREMFGPRAILLRESEICGEVDDGFDVFVAPGIQSDRPRWVVSVLLGDGSGSGTKWISETVDSLSEIPEARMVVLARARQDVADRAADNPEEQCGDCGAAIGSYHACQGVPGGFGDE